jgi:hypothetical protein
MVKQLYAGMGKLAVAELSMPDIEFVRSEIERMRGQVSRQRKEILQLQRAGIATVSAEALLERMQAKIDELCVQRDDLKKGQPGPTKGKVLGGRRVKTQELKWYDPNANNPP